MKLNQLLDSLLIKDADIEKGISDAIQVLKADILVKAKYYEGDLLMTILAVKSEYWKANPERWNELSNILTCQERKIQEKEVSFEMKVDWYEKMARFQSYSELLDGNGQ